MLFCLSSLLLLDAVHAHAVVSLPEPRYDAADKLKAVFALF
jgi:hypothetical protein